MMAKLKRVAALALCMLMLLPSSLAMVAGAENLDDIIDEEVGASQETADPETDVTPLPADDAPSYAELANMAANPSPSADPATEANESADPAAQNTGAANAPTFGSVDITKSVGAATGDLSAAGASTQAADISKNCKYKLTEGKMGKMTDSKVSTYWTNAKKAKITITIPANDAAGGLYLEWHKKPSQFQIVEKDAEGKELQTRDQSAYTGLVSVFPLLPETKKVELIFAKQVRISTLRVFSQGTLPTSIQDWLAPYEKADLMVVSAHQDDEWLYFGGTIPYYSTVRGKAVQTVYMANCGRSRYAEALNGLWYAGERHSPDFIGLPDKMVKTLKAAKKVWKNDTVIEQLVARIRKYKPDVVVSHDPKGEYGHGQHMMTADCLLKAVELAADESKYKASADAYGVWQVQKLYLHLYPEKQMTMDWTQKSDALDGKSPTEVAKLAYAAHKSQQKSFTYEDGGKYDNSKFGLAFSMVGDDELKNDFFENISEGAERLNPAALGAAGTDEAEPEDTDMPDETFFEDEDGMEDDAFPGLDDEELLEDGEPTEDGTEGDDAAVVTPPTEAGTPANVNALLGTLIGVPVVLGGSALGTVAVRKQLKKKRRAARKAEKDQMSA